MQYPMHVSVEVAGPVPHAQEVLSGRILAPPVDP